MNFVIGCIIPVCCINCTQWHHLLAPLNIAVFILGNTSLSIKPLGFMPFCLCRPLSTYCICLWIQVAAVGACKQQWFGAISSGINKVLLILISDSDMNVTRPAYGKYVATSNVLRERETFMNNFKVTMLGCNIIFSVTKMAF